MKKIQMHTFGLLYFNVTGKVLIFLAHIDSNAVEPLYKGYQWINKLKIKQVST